MSTDAILEVRHLSVEFPLRQGIGDLIRRRQPKVVKAVDDVSFSLGSGEVLALAGESGCGKTTTARTLIGLGTATRGEILFKGRRVGGNAADGPAISLKELRQRAQIVFQDPYESLNARATVLDIVAEPLVVHGLAGSAQERLEKVRLALEEAGLRPADDYLKRHPHELSGGQRQRAVIASALVLAPELLLADEPVSMLDVSIRAEILNLLNALRRSRGISILFITHDLGIVGHFADRLAVMYLGRIVEIGPTRAVLHDPQHPYTRALLSVVPVPNPRLRRQPVILQGETPNPLDLPAGCRFHPRCPIAVAECRTAEPDLATVRDAHRVACLLVAPASDADQATHDPAHHEGG
jgi:oligopeptide/dipeptide ABC transporter ATP-binding protein